MQINILVCNLCKLLLSVQTLRAANGRQPNTSKIDPDLRKQPVRHARKGVRKHRSPCFQNETINQHQASEIFNDPLQDDPQPEIDSIVASSCVVERRVTKRKHKTPERLTLTHLGGVESIKRRKIRATIPIKETLLRQSGAIEDIRKRLNHLEKRELKRDTQINQIIRKLDLLTDKMKKK